MKGTVLFLLAIVVLSSCVKQDEKVVVGNQMVLHFDKA